VVGETDQAHHLLGRVDKVRAEMAHRLQHDPHLALTSHSLNIGLHRTRELAGPTLVFAHEDVAALRAQLEAAGVACDARLPPALDARSHLLLVAPEGTRLLVAPPPL
jgi:hypothetical protein